MVDAPGVSHNAGCIDGASRGRLRTRPRQGDSFVSALSGGVSMKDNAVFGGAGHYVADRNYTRDRAGNITAVSIASVLPTANTQRCCYSYDSLKQ
ncbi:hypothetical protein AB0N73_12425 [Microbacterium sp. NPDC089189]|uniref:hypothetical protein n=1 Tax=Microbacterium sp. NPDC089189 TaxID=3154972 RepID=UPI003420DB37